MKIEYKTIASLKGETKVDKSIEMLNALNIQVPWDNITPLSQLAHIGCLEWTMNKSGIR